MTSLFDRGELRDFLHEHLRGVLQKIESLPEDEVLARSADDLVGQYVAAATLTVPELGADPIDGKVSEAFKQVRDQFGLDRTYTVRGFTIGATYEFTGDSQLFYYRPSHHLMTRFEASVGNGQISVTTDQTGDDADADKVHAALARKIDPIRTELGYVSTDVRAYNSGVTDQVRRAVDRRKDLVQKRRNLAGALGFPIAKRQDAPRPVPLTAES